jgi:hypothetical protein
MLAQNVLIGGDGFLELTGFLLGLGLLQRVFRSEPGGE